MREPLEVAALFFGKLHGIPIVTRATRPLMGPLS
jgi:hypothetical protein